MSKKLPKAKLSTMNELYSEVSEPEAVAAVTATPAKPDAPAPTPTPTLDVAAVPAEPGNDQVEIASPVRPQNGLELHRAKALNIVERYTTYSALGSCVPLQLVEGLSSGVIIFNMMRALAKHYGIPFQQDRIKAGITALLAAIASPSAGNIATLLLGQVIPGAWVLGAAASSAAAATLTRYVGHAFIKHLESGGTSTDFVPVPARIGQSSAT